MPSYYRDPDAPTPNVPRRIGVTALIERDGRLLVERRVDDADVWAFVGGTLEDDESALDALAREVREETGYTIEGSALLGIFTDPSRIVAYPDGNVCRFVSIAFRVTPAEHTDPVLSDESREMRFVARAELAELPFWPAQLPIRGALLADGKEIVVA
jgi:8-oxo-dGTP pyrophosphatase MutT (NUDIX family)